MMKNKAVATDYGMWKLMAWSGPVFFTLFFFMWGLLADNFPPMSPNLSAEAMKAHYLDKGLAISIGMSVCMVGGAFYMTWGCAVSRLMRRIEGPEGMFSNLEMMGATITFTPIVVACGIWLVAAMQAAVLSAEIIQSMYLLGWMIIDIAYMVTSFQIMGASIVFLKDTREKKLIPAWVSWWGWVTIASFFPVSLIPFFKTGPFALNGLFNFWVAFPTWYVWIVAMSIYVIKGVNRIEIEDGAAEAKEDARSPLSMAAAR